MKKERIVKKQSGFDEAFKISMKKYFESIAMVETNFEILKLPKKVDLLIIQAEKTIIDYVKIFTYFKRLNIIEFKSEKDRFVFKPDLYDIGIYTNGVLRIKNEYDFEDTTFSLVSSTKPEKLLNLFKASELEKGVYRIDNINLIPIHIVVIEELEIEFEKEVSVLKDFTSKKDRHEYLEEMLKKDNFENKFTSEKLKLFLELYYDEFNKILKERKIQMTIIERNIRRAAEEYGIKRQFIEEGKLEGITEGKLEGIEQERRTFAKKALFKGYPIEEIMELTDMSKEEILELKKDFN